MKRICGCAESQKNLPAKISPNIVFIHTAFDRNLLVLAVKNLGGILLMG